MSGHYFNQDTQRVIFKKHYPSSIKHFFVKVAALLFIIMIVGLNKSNAQDKRVWGGSQNAKFQTFGESYVGFITGSELTPTGISSLMYVTPNSAIHAYCGVKGGGSNMNLINGNVVGLAYQPELTFRTGNLNCGYYLTVGGELRSHKFPFPVNNSARETPLQENSFTTASVNIGVGMFFEVNKKWQMFAERVGRFDQNTVQDNGESMYYTSFGFRFFVLNGIKK